VQDEAKTRFHFGCGQIWIEVSKEFSILMKRSLTVLCVFASAIGAGSAGFVSQAIAQTPDTLSAPAPAGTGKVAVILFQQAVAQTNEGQRAFAQLRQKFEPKQAALKAQSDEVDSLKKQLQDAGTTLSETERDSRLKTIDEKTKTLQRTAEDDQNDFNSEMNETFQTIAQKVFTVVDSYAKQNGYSVVLDASSQQSSPVLWVSPSNDITKAVVVAYNTKSGVAPPAASETSAPTPRTGTTTHHTTHPATKPQ
jgi:outer membrane protein